MLVSPSATAHTYICIMLRQAGLVWTAWDCFALSISNCLTTSSYSLYSNPTLHVFLKCFPLSSLKAKHAWSPVEAGQMAHTPAVKRSHSQPLSICQSGRDCRNESQSIKSLLTPRLRIWLRSSVPAAKVCVIRWEWWKPLSHVKWATSGKEGASYSERISCKSTQKHKTVEVSVSGPGELLVRLTPKWA